MSFVTATAGNSNTNVVNGPTIKNLVLTAAGTEYSYTFPAGTRRFKVKNRGIGLVQYAYAAGQSGVEYGTIEPGTAYWEEDLQVPSLTIYLQSPSNLQTLEIISWV